MGRVTYSRTSPVELAERIGITRQNMYLWRTHGVRGLPARATLDGIADELRLTYTRVLEAALGDVGYLEETDHVTSIRRRGRQVPPSERHVTHNLRKGEEC